MTTKPLSPFDLTTYFRDHAPATARAGMRGYVLRLLVDMARLKGPERGMCWPSISYLADKIGRSARQVQRLLRELETLGEVERVVQRRKDGGQSSNLYRLAGFLAWIDAPAARKPRKPKPATDSQGWGSAVYVATAGPGVVKIGMSATPALRLVDLQSANGEKLSLAYVGRVSGKPARDVERAAHILLEKDRQRGEWFHTLENDAVEAVEQAARLVGATLTVEVAA